MRKCHIDTVRKRCVSCLKRYKKRVGKIAPKCKQKAYPLGFYWDMKAIRFRDEQVEKCTGREGDFATPFA